jgi:DNA-binding NarL/FixJ family response regulator
VHTSYAEARALRDLPPGGVGSRLALGVRGGEACLTLSLPGADESHATAMPSKTEITVVLARFDDLLAEGLRALIGSDPNLAIVAADVEHSRIPTILRAHRPNVAFLDAGALAAPAEVRELSAEHPATSLILLAHGEKGPTVAEASQLLAFGASACLGRDVQSRDVLNAVHLASRGLQVTPRAAPASDGSSIAAGQLLTRREAEVLPLLQLGRPNAQIALALGVSIETVRTHARNIYRKLGVASRRELDAPRVSESQQPPRSGAPSSRVRTATLPTRPRRGHGVRDA